MLYHMCVFFGDISLIGHFILLIITAAAIEIRDVVGRRGRGDLIRRRLALSG